MLNRTEQVLTSQSLMCSIMFNESMIDYIARLMFAYDITNYVLIFEIQAASQGSATCGSRPQVGPGRLTFPRVVITDNLFPQND